MFSFVDSLTHNIILENKWKKKCWCKICKHWHTRKRFNRDRFLYLLSTHSAGPVGNIKKSWYKYENGKLKFVCQKGLTVFALLDKCIALKKFIIHFMFICACGVANMASYLFNSSLKRYLQLMCKIEFIVCWIEKKKYSQLWRTVSMWVVSQALP